MGYVGFTFGGVDLGALGLRVLPGSDAAMAGVKVDVQDRSARDGGVATGYAFGVKEWSVECVVVGTTRDVLRTRMDAVMRALDPRGGEKLFYMNSETLHGTALQRGRLCRVSGGVSGQLQGLSCYFTLNFVSSSAFDVSIAETTQVLTINADPKTLKVPADVSDGETPPHMVAVMAPGNTVAVPVWTLTAGAGVTTFGLANTTTGETFVWQGAMSAGHRLRVDSERMHCELSVDGGTTWSNVMSGVNAASVWPTIDGGVQNTVVVTGVSSGSVSVVYRGRFL